MPLRRPWLFAAMPMVVALTASPMAAGDLLQPGDERPQLRNNVQAWPLARPGRPGLGTEQRIPPTTNLSRVRSGCGTRCVCARLATPDAAHRAAPERLTRPHVSGGARCKQQC